MSSDKAFDCPECEYCCASGLCCPPAAQLAMLEKIFMRDVAGCTPAEAHTYASAIVKAREKASKHQAT